jgi:hypothetical protein
MAAAAKTFTLDECKKHSDDKVSLVTTSAAAGLLQQPEHSSGPTPAAQQQQLTRPFSLLPACSLAGWWFMARFTM